MRNELRRSVIIFAVLFSLCLAVAAPAMADDYWVQVTSRRSEAEALAAYRSLQNTFPNALGNRQARIHRVDLDQGSFFRAMVGPFTSSQEAGALCSDIQAAGGQCLVQVAASPSSTAVPPGVPKVASDRPADCKSIQDPKARLECFDTAPPKTSTAPAKSAPKADPTTTTDGGWQLRRVKDTMTDKKECILSPVGKPHIQITVGDLYISYRGRGGVQGFSYRLDDGPVSKMQLATDIERQIGAVHISGDAFNHILRASRLRVETFTVLSTLLNEDLAVSGMRNLYAKMQRGQSRD
jgi:SPOR domain